LENAGAVRLGENGLFERAADLSLVNVERGDKFDVVHAIPADHTPHDPVGRCVAATAIIFHALHERARAIADAGDRDLDLSFHSANDLRRVRTTILQARQRSSPDGPATVKLYDRIATASMTGMRRQI
jgi:hypothetical protein